VLRIAYHTLLGYCVKHHYVHLPQFCYDDDDIDFFIDFMCIGAFCFTCIPNYSNRPTQLFIIFLVFLLLQINFLQIG